MKEGPPVWSCRNCHWYDLTVDYFNPPEVCPHCFVRLAPVAGNFDCERLLDLKRQVDVLFHLPPAFIKPTFWQRLGLLFYRRRVWREEDQTIEYKRAWGRTFILKSYP